MRFLALTITAVLLISGCGTSVSPGGTGSPTATISPAGTSSPAVKSASPTAAAPSGATSSSPASKAEARPATGGAAGVRLTIDGQNIPLDGEAKASILKSGTVGQIYIDAGKNARGSARTSYGVQLVLDTTSNNGEFKAGFTAKDVQVATFTVNKDFDFSYVSAGAIPGQPMSDLKLDQTTGRLKGSFEKNLNGTAGKFRAKVEFDVPFPN